MTIPATVGDPVSLVMVLEDGNTSMYPQAEIYAAGSTTPLATIDLVHKAKGRYEGSWNPSSVGSYTAMFFVYSDAGHSVESMIYSREAEQVFVTQSGLDDLAAILVRLLGLNLENSFIDNCVYDANLMLRESRLRVFDTKANLDAATEGGVGETGTIIEITLDAEHYGPNRLQWMKMGKVL